MDQTNHEMPFEQKMIEQYSGTTFAVLREAAAHFDRSVAKNAKQALGEEPVNAHRCSHHFGNPDDTSGCWGEPENYCRSDLDERTRCAAFAVRRMQSLTTLGQRIRDAREGAGMTQASLAHALGYKDRNAISNWEADRQLPPLPVIEQLCVTLRSNACWFLGLSCQQP